MIYGLEESLKKEELNKLKNIKEFSKKVNNDSNEFEVAKHHKRVLKMFRRDNTALIYFFMLLILLIISTITVYVTYKKHIESPYIQEGVFVKDLNISGMTKEEAKSFLEEELGSKMKDNLVLEYQNMDYYVAIEQIDAGFNIDSSVEYAYNKARTGDFVYDVKEFLNIYFSNINIDPKLVYSESALDDYLDFIEANLPNQLEQSDFYLEDDELIIVNGKIGAGIVKDELKKTIVASLQDMTYSNIFIDIPTYDKYPDPIDVALIHSEVYKEPQNAYFTTDPYAVYPEVIGVDFDQDAVQNLINENPNSEEYVVKLSYHTPEITTDDIGMEAFPDLLASYQTKYNSSDTDRTTNLRLAAQKINGTVVLPGEIFSYNKVVGKRTIAAGYKNAAIYQDGGVVDGLGGGICQISTTLYNAVIEAGMLIEERDNHMFVPSYASAGKDATVVWGSIDFKFENRRNYPIKIEASVKNGIAKINIYGLKTNEDYDIYNLSIGTKVKKSTDKTLVVESYRYYTDDNGNLVRKDKLYTDTYKKH